MFRWCLTRRSAGHILRVVVKFEKCSRTSPSVVRSVKLLLIAVPMLHWLACLLSYAAQSPGSWLEHYEAERDESMSGSPGRIYLHAIYWVLDTASTRGAGDVTVRTNTEVILVCVIIACSTLLYTAIIANMSTLLLSSDSTWNDHQRRVEVLKAFIRRWCSSRNELILTPSA